MLFWHLPTVGAQPLPHRLEKGLKQLAIQEHKLQTMVDTTRALTLESWRRSDRKIVFPKATPTRLSYNYTSSAVWAYFAINRPLDSQDSFVLQVGLSLLDSVSIYVLDAHYRLVQQVKTGSFDHFLRNQTFSTDHVMPLPNRPGAHHIFVRVVSQQPLTLTLDIYQVDYFQKFNTGRMMLLAAYLGIVLVMAAYNLFIFLATRLLSFLFYVFFIILFGLHLSIELGFLAIFSPFLAHFGHFYPDLLGTLAQITGFLFVIHLLNLKNKLRSAYRVGQVFTGVALCNCLLVLGGQVVWGDILTAILAIIPTYYFWTCGIILYWRGYRPVLFYVLAYLLFYIALAIRIYSLLNQSSISAFTSEVVLLAGSLAEIILLSIALGDKINELRKEKNQAQQEALQSLRENERLIREQNQLLEIKVNERTQELKEANEELGQMNEEIKMVNEALNESLRMVSYQKEEIKVQAENLQELNVFKDRLFSVIAHDLRSPIGSLKSTLMLLDEELMNTDEFRQIRQKLGIQLNSVQEVLENMLLWAFSHLKGEQQAQTGAFEILPIIRQNIQLYDEIAQRKGIEIFYHVHPEPFPDVLADPNQIAAVVRNLLSNALKFTPPQQNKKIGFEIETQGDFAQIRVKDEGEGIDPAKMKQLFEIKSHFTTRGTSNEKGTGLGLILCREFVEQNGGQLRVESQLGQGTTFAFTIPLANKISELD
ncbi:MAG: 7TM diverse intracellular signaling domain-containing protein [Microscillaceae bacterium]